MQPNAYHTSSGHQTLPKSDELCRIQRLGEEIGNLMGTEGQSGSSPPKGGVVLEGQSGSSPPKGGVVLEGRSGSSPPKGGESSPPKGGVVLEGLSGLLPPEGGCEAAGE